MRHNTSQPNNKEKTIFVPWYTFFVRPWGKMMLLSSQGKQLLYLFTFCVYIQLRSALSLLQI